jgi:hypothetical protein
MNWLCVVIAAYSLSVTAVDDRSGTLVVTTLEDSIELSVPANRLTVTLPRGDLVAVNEARTGAAASPRYFHFSDEKRGLNVSGWVEPASSYIGFEKFWIGELRAMKKNGISLKEPPDVVGAGPWQAAAYNIDLPKGVSANVRAELISAGTWVDLHISVTRAGPAREAREEAVQFLKSIVAKERQ